MPMIQTSKGPVEYGSPEYWAAMQADRDAATAQMVPNTTSSTVAPTVVSGFGQDYANQMAASHGLSSAPQGHAPYTLGSQPAAPAAAPAPAQSNFTPTTPIPPSAPGFTDVMKPAPVPGGRLNYFMDPNGQPMAPTYSMQPNAQATTMPYSNGQSAQQFLASLGLSMPSGNSSLTQGFGQSPTSAPSSFQPTSMPSAGSAAGGTGFNLAALVAALRGQGYGATPQGGGGPQAGTYQFY